jgi:hypothetical protein
VSIEEEREHMDFLIIDSSHSIVMATFLNWNLGKEKRRRSRNPSNVSISNYNPNPDQYAAYTHFFFLAVHAKAASYK